MGRVPHLVRAFTLSGPPAIINLLNQHSIPNDVTAS